MGTYTQLTQEERYQIYALKSADHTPTEISRILDRHKATISRELRRNQGLRGYRPQQAQALASSRRQNKTARLLSSHWSRVKACSACYLGGSQNKTLHIDKSAQQVKDLPS